jgi:uncharacterized protein YkwD
MAAKKKVDAKTPLPAELPEVSDLTNEQSETAQKEELPIPSKFAKDCIEADPFICEVERIITKKTNDARFGDSLAHSASLSYVSRLWSKTQSDRGFISHEGFPGRRQQRFNGLFKGAAETFPKTMMAENVAVVVTGERSATEIADALFQLWWESPGHRQNLLGPYRSVGVGVVRADAYTFYGTQIFAD